MCDQPLIYEDIISQVLERHLDVFVGAGAQAMQRILAQVIGSESRDALERDKQWLSALNRAGADSASQPHLESVATIKAAMAKSITACLAMSTGKPLLDLLRKYAASMGEYAQILVKLFRAEYAASSAPSTSAANNLKGFLNKNSKQHKEPLETQLKVVYGCMAHNTCVRAREWLRELRRMGATSLQPKYRNGCRRELEEAATLFLSMEEQALELMALAVRRKLEPLLVARQLELGELKQQLLAALDDFAGNCGKLLSAPAAEHFWKCLVAQLGQRLYEYAVGLRVPLDLRPSSSLP